MSPDRASDSLATSTRSGRRCGARPRRSSGASRRMASFVYAHASSTTTGSRRRSSHRIAQRLDNHDAAARADPQRLRRGARGRPGARRGDARRHRRRLRPRSGLPPLHRAGALLQRLPRDPDAPPGALAVATRAGAISRSICRAARRRSSRPTSIPAVPMGTRHLPRPRDRPRRRRDGGDRGRRLDPAGRDARRHRQGGAATAIRRSATAC